MDITPVGNVRMVFSGPVRLMDTVLGDWAPVSPTDLLRAARKVAAQGGFSVRPEERDETALKIFDLAGTTESPYPLGLVAALDLETEPIEEILQPTLESYLSDNSVFSTVQVVAAIVRLFGNGYASVVLIVEFAVRPGVLPADYLAFLAQRFDYADAGHSKQRDIVTNAVRKLVKDLCLRILVEAGVLRHRVFGRLLFLSVFYVLSSDWDPLAGEELRLDPRLRPLLQPECGDNLVNQSTTRSELVIYTSGFHIYVWNSRVTRDPVPRTVQLVSFLSLMNIVYDQLEQVKVKVTRKLVDRDIGIFEKTDLDEQMEILYSQVMVSSTSWRRDISSFRDQIDRRWNMGALKQHCVHLIAELEARSARKKRIAVGFIIALFTAAQLTSIIADGHQLAKIWGLVSG